MKLRICGNSIRVRLGKAEVAHLAAGGMVTQTTAILPGACLVTSVETSPKAPRPNATFADGRLLILLPAESARHWAASEKVSLEGSQDAGEGQTLSLLVEKDFECLHNHAASSPDAFPNPRRAAGA